MARYLKQRGEAAAKPAGSPQLPLQAPLDFRTVRRIAVGPEHKADVADRGARRRLRPGEGIDVFPDDIARWRHLEDAAPQALADQRVARP